MAELKVNEIYASIQGEGPHTGDATTFIRFGGCNLRCPGWGYGTLPDGTVVPGCDTIHAVYPEWRGTWPKMTQKQIIDEIDTAMVTFTGGEPFIQPASKLEQLGMALSERGHTLEVFTNGTVEIPRWFTNLGDQSYIIMDFKLPGSGEFGKFYNLNLTGLREHDTIKFVCKDDVDVEKAVEMMAVFQNFTSAQFSMGVVWDSDSLSEGTLASVIANEITEVSLNIQTHKHIWDPEERRR